MPYRWTKEWIEAEEYCAEEGPDGLVRVYHAYDLEGEEAKLFYEYSTNSPGHLGDEHFEPAELEAAKGVVFPEQPPSLDHGINPSLPTKVMTDDYSPEYIALEKEHDEYRENCQKLNRQIISKAIKSGELKSYKEKTMPGNRLWR